MGRRRVFVVGAHHPTGGARMAHWIGRVAAESFGFELVNVFVRDTPSGPLMFGDPEIARSVPLADVCAAATADDLLICNPVFSSFGLGRNFPGRSICYVQGIRTFELLDKFTHYVSVSVAAADCLAAVYGLKTAVIPPFYDLPVDSVRNRRWLHKKNAILTIDKQNTLLQQAALQHTVAALRRELPGVELTTFQPYSLPLAEYPLAIAEPRFVLAFSPVEGFGLMPLEAMACGAVVLGLNGVGGRDYMLPGVNCLTVEWLNYESIAAEAVRAINDQALCLRISDAARQTALQFTREKFMASWRAELGRVLS